MSVELKEKELVKGRMCYSERVMAEDEECPAAVLKPREHKAGQVIIHTTGGKNARAGTVRSGK